MSAAPSDDQRLALIRKDLETAREALMRVMRVADAMEPITALLGETPQRLHLRAGFAVLLIDDCSQAARDLAYAVREARNRFGEVI